MARNAKAADPFSDEPDEAQTEIENTPPKVEGPWDEPATPEQSAPEETKTPARKATTKKDAVQVGSDGKIVLTFKGGSGFDAPWVVLHATDTADALSTMADPDFKKLMDWTAAGAKSFNQKWTESGGAAAATGARNAGGSQNRGNSGGGGNRNNGGGNRGGNSGGETRYCDHEQEMRFKSGSKNGKPWSAYFCTVQGDECQPQWVK